MFKKIQFVYILSSIASFFCIQLLSNFLQAQYHFYTEKQPIEFSSTFFVLNNPKQKTLSAIDLSKFEKITLLAKHHNDFGIYDPQGSFVFKNSKEAIHYFSKSDYLNKTKKYITVNDKSRVIEGYLKTGALNESKNIDVLINLSAFHLPIEQVYFFGEDSHTVFQLLKQNGFEPSSTKYVSIFESIFYFLFSFENKYIFIISQLLLLSVFLTFLLTIFYARSLKKIYVVSLQYGASFKKLCTRFLFYPFFIITGFIVVLGALYQNYFPSYFSNFHLFNFIELFLVMMAPQLLVLMVHLYLEVKKCIV